MKLTQNVIAPLAFILAAIVALMGATWAVSVIEARSREAVATLLSGSGQSWATVTTDGLQVHVGGTAPTEAERFRALSLAGSIVDAARVMDRIEVAEGATVAPPDFTVEILRNDTGISLIGLVPAAIGRESVVADVEAIDDSLAVTDMLETADYAVPEGWEDALAFGVAALDMLPRSKISIDARRVAITAIGDSAQEQRRLEAELKRRAPEGLAVEVSISAPRPVVTPYTLRFLIDGDGARFDACVADTDAARSQIMAAATDAGAPGGQECTVALGVPSPRWGEAVATAIGALTEMGGGSLTFLDADVSLIAAETVAQADFDRIVGELDTALPDVFSLHAVLTPRSNADGSGGAPRFTGTLAADGRVQLRGLLSDERLRAVVESYAQSRFGAADVYLAPRLDAALPRGWGLRVLAGLGALAELDSGSLVVEPELVSIEGSSGDRQARDRVSRLLSERLGGGEEIRIAIRYDETLDPQAAIPEPGECMAKITATLDARKIAFEPGSATFNAEALPVIDAVAGILRGCPEMPIEIAGHTDSQGREEMNLALSQQRADAVLQALMQRRVLVAGIAAKGYGETVPVADNETEAGREANRRITFTLRAAAAGAGGGGGAGAGAGAQDGAAAGADAPAPQSGESE